MKDRVLADKMQQLEDSEMELAQEMRPPMDFSPSAVKSVIKSMNKLIDLFPPYEKVDEEIFPETLDMFVRAINDAVLADAIDEKFECEPPASDMDLKYLAGKLDLLAKPKEKKAFAKFLSEAPPMAEMQTSSVAEEPAPVEEETDPVLRALM